MSRLFLFLGGIGGSELLLIMVMILPALLIFFLPSFIARKRPDFIVVLLVNILAGWSVIGWVAALYLALRKTPVEMPVAARPAVGFVADELAKLRDLRDQGVLTETEFDRQKAQLLG